MRLSRALPMAAALLLTGCALIDLSSFSVSTHPAVPNEILESADALWVQFSEPVERSIVEPFLSVTAGGESVQGDLSWEENRLIFTPVEPFSRGIRHVLQLQGTVRTMAGRTFNELIMVPFYVGTDAQPPIIAETTPPEGAVVGKADSLMLTFSEPMDADAFKDAFSVTPTTEYRVSWNSNGTQVTIVPVTRWSAESLSTWSVTTACKSIKGVTVGRAWSGTFLVQEEATSPTVVSTGPAAVTGATVLPLPGGLSSLIYGDSLLITFSEDVDAMSLDTAFSLSPSREGTMRRVSSGIFVFVPSDGWLMGQEYVLSITTDLKDTFGNPMRAPYRELFTPGIPAQAVTEISLMGDLVDTPLYDASQLNNSVPSVINWVLSASVPDSALVLCITVRFAQGYDAVHQPSIANALHFEGYYPDVVSPQVTQENWMDSRTLRISYTGFTRSANHPSLERLFYKLTLPSGPDQTMNQEGSFLNESVTLLLESGSDS